MLQAVFQGCWIEQCGFQGYRGSSDYPDFLRRMNGLGHAVGASIWPAEIVDEKKHFREIVTAIAMMENWMVWVNDLISFYKEFDDDRDQTSLVRNYCHVDGLTINEGLERLTCNTLRVTEQIMSVFADKDPAVSGTLTKFMHGYVTWHLCDARYRISEIDSRVGDGEAGSRFRRYFQAANRVGKVDPATWAIPQSAPSESTVTQSSSWVSAVSTSHSWRLVALLAPIAAVSLAVAWPFHY